jgi:hypothetical protein
VILLLALSAVVAWDVLTPRSDRSASRGVIGVPEVLLDDPEPRIGIRFNSKMRFGLVMLKEHDPRNPDKLKQLTAREDGSTNNTCIRVDGYEDLFGQAPGDWVRDKKKHPFREVALGPGRFGAMSYWESPRNVRVRQTIEIIPNEQTRLLDTCLIHYLLENKDSVPHKVGLRVMLDTYIGANDGVPFVIPGQPGLLQAWKQFGQNEIPDYIEALENSDLKNPGTVANMSLKLRGIKIQPDDPEPEPLESLLICRWPGTSEKKWSWEPRPMNDKSESPDAVNDSCVVLYWAEDMMAPGAKRAMAFTYGLGKVSSTDAGELGMTVGGSFRPGGVFTVTAYVQNPKEGQRVKLLLPPGLRLDESAAGPRQSDELTVAKGTDFSQVSWRVCADAEGEYHVEVNTGLNRAHQRVRIRRAGLFN